MKVDICGDLLLEPNSLRQQPSTTTSHCTGHCPRPTKNIQFSELNRIEVPVIGCKTDFILECGEQRGVLGFTLNEEQWSLLNKSHLADLEPYERRKMCSLPKSFTPFSSRSVGDGGLECGEGNVNRSASNSILLRKCESLNPTPSQCLINGSEPNNNNIAHPSSLSKILLLHKSQERFQEDEKENWLSDEGWNEDKEPESPEKTEMESSADKIDEAPVYQDVEKDGSLAWEGAYNIGPNVEGVVEVEFLPAARFPLTQSSTAVGTIGSHPNPILCCAADQAHHHQHQDLSVSQQTSFPTTLYDIHSIDPLLYAECYDDWNANAASLCENNMNSTPVLYQDVLSMNVNGFSLPPPPQAAALTRSRFFDNYVTNTNSAAVYEENEDQSKPSRGGVVEEVNTLSTFLSKFDDKVAAIWGQQGSGRSALGANMLGTDGCISSASTPLGSSNPWGSPSSEISGVHAPSDYRFLPPHQHAKQMSLAADALLSGGYGFNQNQCDGFQCEQQIKSQHHSGRLGICDITISPPKGNYNIMHSMKQYFGTAPPENEYHIIKRDEATSSEEELRTSLSLINHDEEKSGFVAYKYSSQNLRKDVDINMMTRALDTLDLDNDVDDEWEIVEACNKGKSQSHDGEDLLNSWKTHFRTIDQVETIANVRGIDLLESPVTTISVHQINPNLPEYRLFDPQVDGEHRVFDHPGRTLFPIKYKVFRENERGNQTDDFIFESSPSLESSSQCLSEYRVASDWTKYQLSLPTFELSTPTGAAGSTPTETQAVGYEGESGSDFPSSDWYNLSKGMDYNGMWSGWALADDSSNTLLAMNGGGGEYCDSGVGGVGSRSDFYDDMFGEYEGDYENYSSVGYPFAGFVPSSEVVDTDYGQFHDVSGCDSSSASGKQSKSNRRNKARLRPCKYYFMEGSCRRGNDCKFSHDSVTCRYWAEGSCLKGQACPYVHCFIDGKKVPNQEEFGLRANGIPENQYHLESETDFPALCSTKNSMLSSRQPMTLGFSSTAGDAVRRLEDSLESLTVFTDSNSSVMEEEVNEPRRLFLFERMRASPSSSSNTTTCDEKTSKKQNEDGADYDHSMKDGNREALEWSEAGSRALSKSKSVGDANCSSQWARNSVSRSNSHSFTTSMSLGIPIKEKRKKKKH